jgi:hypothetical protein
LLVRAQELGELGTDIDVDLAVQMLTGSVLARRVSGIPSAPDWARRAIDMISTGEQPLDHSVPRRRTVTRRD